MAIDPRKRQKKLERHAAKRKAKHRQFVRASQAGLPQRLSAAANCPILHCWVTEDVWTEGIGWVCLSRELPNGSIAFSTFLVDRYCLGVKDAMSDIVGRYTYNEIVGKVCRRFTTQAMDPATARKFVEGAVAYAHALGLAPHPDYQRAKLIFGTIDASECTKEFEYGKDGQPFFIAGPNDGPERCGQILRALEQNGGTGRYHYLMPISGSTLVQELDEEEGDEE